MPRLLYLHHGDSSRFPFSEFTNLFFSVKYFTYDIRTLSTFCLDPFLTCNGTRGRIWEISPNITPGSLPSPPSRLITKSISIHTNAWDNPHIRRSYLEYRVPRQGREHRVLTPSSFFCAGSDWNSCRSGHPVLLYRLRHSTTRRPGLSEFRPTLVSETFQQG